MMLSVTNSSHESAANERRTSGYIFISVLLLDVHHITPHLLMKQQVTQHVCDTNAAVNRAAAASTRSGMVPQQRCSAVVTTETGLSSSQWLSFAWQSGPQGLHQHADPKHEPWCTVYIHTRARTPCCTIAAHTCYPTISGCHGISSGHPREQAFSQGYQYAVGLGNHAWHKAYTAQRYLHNIITTTGHKAHVRGHMRAHNNNITPHTTAPVSSCK